jgi:hypothetical protein
MNFQAAFEGGLAAALTQTAEWAEAPRIRVWHALTQDARWSKSSDRVFPLVAFRAEPPRTNEDGVTQLCNVQCLVGTNIGDDQDHETLALYQAGLQETLGNIYAQWRNDSAPAAALDAFTTYIADSFPEINNLISIGGYEHGEVLAPFEEGGANYEGKAFVIHYSRSDY